MRSLSVSWDDPMIGARKALTMSGLEYLQAVVSGEIPRAPISDLLGFHLTEISAGYAVFECTPGEQHYNPIGVVHGGLACTLLDSSMGCAVHSMQPAGVGHTTLELKVNLVRPVTMKSGLLRCEGRIIHNGRSTATAEGKLLDAEGRLYAHGTTTCMLFPKVQGKS